MAVTEKIMQFPHVDLSIREAQERWGERLWVTYRGVTTFPHFKDETGLYKPVFNSTQQCVGYCKCEGVPTKQCWSCTCAKGDEPRAFEAAQNVMLGRVTVFEIEPGAEGPDTIRLHFHRVTD